MLRRLTLLFTLCVFLFLFAVPSVLSQNSDITFDQAFEAFNRSKGEYESAHGDYVFSRAQYLRFRTLQSQNEARDATLEMLIKRDDVVLAYITALRERLEEAHGLADEAKNDLYVQLDAESSWFNSHKAELPGAATPEDFIPDSNEARNRFESASPIFYEVLATVSYGRVNDMRDRLKELFNLTRGKVDEIKGDTREEYAFSAVKFLRLDRWLFESEERIARAEEKLAEVEEMLINFSSLAGTSQANYNSTIQKMEESRGYMREALSSINEIIKDVKTAEH